jgi:hypothetical protein
MYQLRGANRQTTGTFAPITFCTSGKQVRHHARAPLGYVERRIAFSCSIAPVMRAERDGSTMVANTLARMTCCASLEASHTRTMHGLGNKR